MDDQQLLIAAALKAGWTEVATVPRMKNGVQDIEGRSPEGFHRPLPPWLTSIDAAKETIEAYDYELERYENVHMVTLYTKDGHGQVAWASGRSLPHAILLASLEVKP